ncbi:DUF4345 family protein [Caulobacter soli]|uniref:DUF4345 family protein n=1 Tax=Caulobacter soli TaxID=2708539 RepID=UPI0013EE2DAC
MIACVIGGVQGGLTLARPGSVLGLTALEDEDDENAAPSSPRTEGRALGGLLILSHATAALFLGYQSNVGAAMAFALAMAWLGAALGRAISALVDGARDRFNLGSLAFEIMIAATLSLPFFNAGRLVVLRGHGMLV